MSMSQMMWLVQNGLTDFGRISASGRYLDKTKIKADGDYVEATVRSNRNLFVQLNLSTGSYSCTCSDFDYRRVMCKHIIAVIRNLDEESRNRFFDALGKKAEASVQQFVSLGDKGIDKLLRGGFVRKNFFNLFGRSKVGKTWLVLQTLFLHGGIYIDTEDSMSNPVVVERYREIFEERFGSVKHVEVLPINVIEDLLGLVGLEATVDKKGDKVEANFFPVSELRDSALYQFAKETKANLIVIDSFSELLKKSFAAVDQNFPARASLINAFLPRFRAVLSALGAAGVVVNHISAKRNEEGQLFGGGTMKYHTKYALRLQFPPMKIQKKYGEMARVMTRFYYPTLEEESIVVKLEKDYGFVTVE